MYKIKIIDCDSVPELLKLIKWPSCGLPLKTAQTLLNSKIERKNRIYFELLPVQRFTVKNVN